MAFQLRRTTSNQTKTISFSYLALFFFLLLLFCLVIYELVPQLKPSHTCQEKEFFVQPTICDK